MHIPIVTEVQNAPTSLRKNSHILLKTFFLRLSFPDEGRLYAKFLFDIFTIYPKCHLFQFFSRGIRMHIPILIVVQNEPESHRKDTVFCWKMFLSKFFYVEEGHFYANCLFIFLLFMLNTFFSGSEVVAYLCLLPSLQGFILMLIAILTGVQNERTILWKNSQILLKNIVFEALCPRWRSLVCQIFVWYFDYLS